MGKKQARSEDGCVRRNAKLDGFGEAVGRQLADKQRSVRVFDVGGSGVKTGLFTAAAMRAFLRVGPWRQGLLEEGPEELDWVEEPSLLGQAPGEDGFSSWLLRALPRLKREVEDAAVVFGVSTAGDVEHATGLLHDWWSGGGHPREWNDGRPSPHVADLMGLPRARTFVLHDGAAHLLGCSRRAVPPPNLACFAVGTGVGFGLTDSNGAMVDPSTEQGGRSHLISGAPLSGARYQGIWKKWLELPERDASRVEEVMAREFAGTSRPWRTPWVSLVLGRRGMELCEAAHGCQAPTAAAGACGSAEGDDARAGGSAGSYAAEGETHPRGPAVRAYSEQWLHFLHTEFAPHFAGSTRRHRVDRICFGGRVAELNWDVWGEELVALAGSSLSGTAAGDAVNADAQDSLLVQRLRELPPGTGGAGAAASAGGGGAGAKRSKAAKPRAAAAAAQDGPPLEVLPLAPKGSALIGAGIYALGGLGGAAMGVWAP